MSATPSSISCDVDFDKKGRQISFLRLLYSDNRHAYGMIPVPIAVVAGGSGPTVLLTAGTHGDEYEGQVILQHLMREVDPASLNGRLIIMPALNYPAVLAFTRVSPLDDGNMNRVFPGDPTGTPTPAIANYVNDKILPMCDAGLDLHSGGFASEYIPCAFLRNAGDESLKARKLAITEAFGAPLTVVVPGGPGLSSLLATADVQGVPMLATELGGCGSVNLDALEIGRRGVNQVLHHLGVLDAGGSGIKPAATRFVQMPGPNYHVHAPVSGLFEPYCELGDEVVAGQKAGCLHPRDNPDANAVEVEFGANGTVLTRRVPAVSECGDYLFSLATDLPRENLL
jgi:predicted deacylase